MKEIYYNDDNLTDEEIDEVEIRAKALIINSKNEILLVYSYNTYHFPGGHIENNEDVLSGLIREIKEETGMDIEPNKAEYMLKISNRNKNFINTQKNVEHIMYYYVVKTDKKPNLEEMNLDSMEKKGNFKLVTVSLDNLEKLLLTSLEDNPVNKGIVKEMISAYNYYLERG